MWKFLLAAVLAFMSILIFFPFLLFLDSSYVFIFIVIGAYFIYLKFEENDDEHKTNTKSTQKPSNINNSDIKSTNNTDLIVDRKKEDQRLVKNIYSGNTVTDIDGNVYKTVKIGNQTWMAENLRVSRYRNGDIIPNVQDDEDWCNLETGAWCIYDNNPDNDLKYGKLYNWFAVDDKSGLAPEGWHVPSGREWNNLLTHLIGEYWSEGNVRIQTDGLPIWLVNNIGITNKDGLCAMPFGARLNKGEFDEYDDFANFWYSTECRFDSAWSRKLRHYNNAMRAQGYPKYYGLSVRCVKNEIFD
jgi:uncharacterized protein (TIGR02145 family)